MITVAIVGILAAVAIPAFLKYIKRSKSVEAAINVRRIYDGEVAYFMEETASQSGVIASKQFVSTGPNPVMVPGTNKVTTNWETGNWALLKFGADSPVFYRYTTVTSGVGTTAAFTVMAEGDLDGDGKSSLFERVGSIDPTTGEVVGGAGLYSDRELE